MKHEHESLKKKAPPAVPVALSIKEGGSPGTKYAGFHDVAIHGTNGTIIHRYEEIAPGQWKKVAELTPEQAAKIARHLPGLPRL